MAESEEEMPAVTPSVTLDLADTRPATMNAIESVEGDSPVDTSTGKMDPELNRAVSVTSFSEMQASALSELLQPMDADPFDEDQSELRFLHSKPTCFVVVGKPGVGKTTLAKKLAQNWRCQLVSPTELIHQNMELQTEIGNKASEILLRGEALPEEMVAKMIEDKINSQEVAHHGYVLDGFPSLSEEYMRVVDQLELVKNWKHKPDFIVNLKVPDSDLHYRRTGQRVDPLTNEMYVKDQWDPEKPEPEPEKEEGEEEEEMEEEEEGEEEMGEEEGEEETVEVGFEIIERLVKRPEDLPQQVDENIQTYKDMMLRVLEDYMADHDQQYVIEIDSNKNANQVFKDLQTKLNTFTLRRAAVPIRLHDPDGEEIPEDLETDELMRTLAGNEMVAPRYRWRRGRWARACPVELQRGNVVMGKPEFAVSFLDKIYVLSSEEAMECFLKNPRPFLIAPQPRPPCKLCVTGPPLAGKTTLCHLIAQKYGAKVLNMDELIKSRMEAHKEKQVQLAREEALETAIINVQTKLKEREENTSDSGSDMEEAAHDTEAEQEGKTEDEQTGRETTDIEETDQGEVSATGDKTDQTETDQEKPDQTESETEKTDIENTEAETEPEKTEDEDKTSEGEGKTSETTEGGEGKVDESAATAEDAAPEAAAPPPPAQKAEVVVDANHPEVKALVDAAVKDAEKQVYTLSPEQYIDALEEAISDVQKELKKNDPDGPVGGGWILDNFPRTRDQWTVMIDRGLMPDEIICLRDTSESGTILLKRWYKLNRSEIDEKIKIRLEEEAKEKARREEEARLEAERERQEEEERRRAEEEERRRRRIEEGEESEDSDMDGDTKKGDTEEEGEKETENEAPAEEKEPLKEEGSHDEEGGGGGAPEGPSPEEGSGEEGNGEAKAEGAEGAAQPPEEVEDPLPPDGPETQQFKESRQLFEAEWPTITALITGTSSLEPIVVDLLEEKEEAKPIVRKVEDVFKDAVNAIERPYSYQPWEYTSIDIDEEEEDAEHEEEEEMDEEEDEEVARNKKKQFGDSKHFCPVSLKDNYILYPGNPEVAAKYREKLYYFSSTEARDKFLNDPAQYVAKDRPLKAPPIRLLILGPRGAGKTSHGRKLARNLGLFHIAFKERLQELIIAKTKKKIGPEFEEDEEEPDEEEEEAITAPDGTAVKPEGEEKEEGAEGDGEKTEEEPEVEFTEEEEAIKANLQEDEPLPPEVLDNIVPEWWNKEPFKSNGFVLEGFPRTADEAQYLGQMGLFPDAALMLVVEDTDITDRLLPPKLAKWKAKRDKRLAKKERKKLKKQKERDEAMEKRRQEILADIEQRKAERMAQKLADKDSDESDASDNEDEEDEEEEDVDGILAEEFEEDEEEEEEEEELEEDAIDRLKNEIGETYDTDTNNLAAVQEVLEELMIPRIELNGGRKPHIVRYTINQSLRPIVDYRQSLLEKVYPLSDKLAKKMLQVGYKHPSRFGKWCPVQLQDGECIQPMQGPGYPTYPVIYRQNIYFMSSLQARDKFIQDPLHYLKQPSPKPVVAVRMAILGPPKSGKTTLANRFAQDFGMVRLSIGEALRTVLNTQSKTELAKEINLHLRKGLTVPDELAIQALEVALLDMRCQCRGYILDGFPLTKKQVDLMTERSIIPVRVLELEVDSKELMLRGMKDRHSSERSLPLHDSAQILAIRMAAWQKEISPVREWYKDQHRNWIPISGERSKWWVWQKAGEEGRKSVHQIQTYLQKISDGNAASIADMCVTPEEFNIRLGDFGQYCPVSLAKRGELVDCSVHPTLDFAAEFRGRYYKMGSKEDLNEFLENPEQFVPPLAPHPLPPEDMRPKRRTQVEAKAMFPIQMELQGYCPVTYLDGKCRYEAIVPGDPTLIVEYRGKLYCFESEDKLQKFLRLPGKYYGLKLPHKLPPKKNVLSINSLPMLGYMEQAVSSAIIKAMTASGCFKPKYPFLSPTRSALLYVAYHLKAHNPKSSEYVRKKYKQKLMRYEEQCELIKYLGENMTLRYKEPQERPIDFDHKMDTFFGLQLAKPTATWIA
ncbi:adenylate kinase 9-like isoform X2 [Glandiceps talaboti]